MQNYSDIELIKNYKQSNKTLYVGELYKRYTRFVFLISMKYLKNETDSKEAVMQIFEKLLTDLKKHKIENFKSWLHVVTKNFCFQELRRRQNFQKKHDEYENFSTSFMEKEEEMHHSIEQQKEIKLQALEKAVSELNNEQRKCIELFYLQEKSYKEVVELTGFEMKKVKSYIQNGKRNLKLLLQNGNLAYLFLLYQIKNLIEQFSNFGC